MFRMIDNETALSMLFDVIKNVVKFVVGRNSGLRFNSLLKTLGCGPDKLRLSGIIGLRIKARNVLF